MVQALGNFGKEKLTEITNAIYDTGKIPKDLSKSTFTALPIMPGAIKCELHHDIRLRSHITKVTLQVILTRIQSKMRCEIAKEQCGFVEDARTRNSIFMLRMLGERAVKVKSHLYVFFLDNTKAFDKVGHEEMLQNLDVDGKEIS